MTTAKRLDEIQPGEIIPMTWDFSADFEDAGLEAFSITGTPNVVASVDTSLWRGVDPDVTDMLVGGPQVDGKIVMQMVEGRVHGVDYKVRCEVTIDSTPQAKLFQTSIIPVRTA